MSEYMVLINEEEQYSIWRADQQLPDGWTYADFTGSRQECLDHVDRVWSDMRPRSIREIVE